MADVAGPAADNLRAQLTAAINEAKETWEAMGHHDSAPAAFLAARLVPLVTVVGDARYQEGRNDAATAIASALPEVPTAPYAGASKHDAAVYVGGLTDAARLARGEG